MKAKVITSDVTSRLAKIRSGVVYNSITSVISELLQNSQRAKAKTIQCTIRDNVLTIIDDGVGCQDPNDLFTIDKSVWESTDEGFGEGFTSVYTVADVIIVRSRKWSVQMNIAKMIEERNLSYEPRIEDNDLKGFEIIILGDKIDKNRAELESFLKYSASLLPMDVYVNGELISKKDLSAIHGSTDFNKTYENKLYTAHLTPTQWNGGAMTYYESREVCKEWLTGVTGNIILKPHAVNLIAPDRKAIVCDDKYSAFTTQLEKDIKKMYREFITLADNSLINQFSYPIACILDIKEYEDLLEIDESMFDVHASDDEYAKDADKKEAKLKDEILKPKLDIFNTNLERKEENRETEFHFPPIECKDQEAVATVSDAVKALNPRARKRDLVALAKSNKIFWVRPDEIKSAKESITNMEYYGFKGIIAVNELYERVFREYKVPHVSYLVKNIKKQHKYTDVGARTLKEKRALFLLRRIEKHYKIGETFNICNITMKIVSQFDDKELQSPDSIIEGVCTGEGKIYLDRRSLKLGDFTVKNWATENVNLEDLRFILRASDTLAHELAHLLYGTNDNTLAHMQAQAKIAKEIGYLY